MTLDTYVTTVLLVVLLSWAAYQDATTRQIPNQVTAGLVGLGAWRWFEWGTPNLTEIGGVLVIFLLLYLATEFIWRKRNVDVLGLGDIKLMLGIGCAIGFIGLWFTVFIGSVGGIAWKLARHKLRNEPLNESMPFGPFLSISALMAWGLQQ